MPTVFEERLADLMVEHAGKHIAANDNLTQVFASPSAYEARLHAAASGVTAPIMFYCPPLKPYLEPRADRVRLMIDELRTFYPSELGVTTAIKALTSLEADLRRRSCDAATHERAERIGRTKILDRLAEIM